MKHKHTPWPWKVEKELSSRSGEWLIALDTDRGRGIAIAETIPATGKELANARLIASAPDLLEALHEAAEYIGDRSAGSSRFWDLYDAAIAKATGV